MGVDLGFIRHTVGADAEGEDGPIQIGLPLVFFQRQAFTQRRFVNLDDAKTGFFEVEHFVADSERDLQAGF